MSDEVRPEVPSVEDTGPKKPGGKTGLPFEEARLVTGRANLAAARANAAAQQAKIREKRDAGEISRYQQYLRGELTIADMDDEEVGRGQWKDLAGGWMGGHVQRLTSKQHQDIKRELLRRGQVKLESAYLGALNVLQEIATSGAAADKDRLKAATLLMERVAGKVPDRVEVGGADAFSDVLQGIIDDSVVERRNAEGEAELPE